MRISVLLCLFSLVLTAPGQAFDTDGDGVVDWNATVLTDQDCDGSFDRTSEHGSVTELGDSLYFTKVWDSGTILNNQWDACCGYFDRDSLLDILGQHWSPNMLHVFESDGAGGYDHIWQQTESLPPGSYVTVCSGDPDDDGEIEILGGECSGLGKVVLFENTGNDSWGNPVVPIRLRNERIRTVRIADTNRNGKNEIVIIAGNVDGGGVYIFEHTGPPGVHTYSQIYHYSTVSYLFQGGVGDVDNDGYPEVLLGCGGWHGFPMYIRRIVYDSAARSYSHKMFQSTVIGLHLTPMVCDVDSSGENNLVVGSSGGPNGQVHVFKYTGNNTFAPIWSSSMSTDGNVISVQAAAFQGYAFPLIFAAPFSGAVYGFVKDDTAFHTVSCFSPGTGAPIRSIDAARDIRDQLVLAEAAPSDYVSVYRRDPPQGLANTWSGSRHPGLTVHPNPCLGPVSITSSYPVRRIEVFDAGGRFITRLDTSLPVVWDRTDKTGTRVKSGVYLLRVVTGESLVQSRIVVLD